MTGQLAELLSFRRIADIPVGAYLAAPDSWQLTGHHGELRLGHSLPRGPIERDQQFGTWWIEVRLARGPLRLPGLIRLNIEPHPQTPLSRCTGKPRGWSPTTSARSRKAHRKGADQCEPRP